MVDQVQFVDNLARVKLGRPARVVTLNRVAAGGLLLPVACGYAALVASTLVLSLVRGEYMYYYWHLAFLPSEVGRLVVTHPRLYVGALVGTTAWGGSRWRAARPTTSRSGSTVVGLLLLVAAVPGWNEAGPYVYGGVAGLWLLETVWAGRSGESYWADVRE